MQNPVNRILNFMKSIISAAFACAALLAVNPNSEIYYFRTTHLAICIRVFFADEVE